MIANPKFFTDWAPSRRKEVEQLKATGRAPSGSYAAVKKFDKKGGAKGKGKGKGKGGKPNGKGDKPKGGKPGPKKEVKKKESGNAKPVNALGVEHDFWDGLAPSATLNMMYSEEKVHDRHLWVVLFEHVRLLQAVSYTHLRAHETRG